MDSSDSTVANSHGQDYTEFEKKVYSDFDKEKLTRSQQKAVESSAYIIQDHLQESDLSGALRDLQGNPVTKANGDYWNHEQEVREAYAGLVRARNSLEGSLKNPNLDSETRIFLEKQLNNILAYQQKVEDIFAEFRGIN